MPNFRIGGGASYIKKFLQKGFFLTWFSAIVDCHFLTENFFQQRVLPLVTFVLTV